MLNQISLFKIWYKFAYLFRWWQNLIAFTHHWILTVGDNRKMFSSFQNVKKRTGKLERTGKELLKSDWNLRNSVIHWKVLWKLPRAALELANEIAPITEFYFPFDNWFYRFNSSSPPNVLIWDESDSLLGKMIFSWYCGKFTSKPLHIHKMSHCYLI